MLRSSLSTSLLAALLLCSTALRAQQVIPTVGKDFWLGFMENLQPSGLDESLDIFISSSANTSGTVTIPLSGFSVSFSVVANVTTTVNIPQALGEHYSSEVVENMGVHVETLDTVSVFAINFQSYTADASMILPVGSLGTDYMTINEDGYVDAVDNVSEFLIVATQDGTEIEITTTAPTQGGQVPGVPWIVQLDAGESYQVQADQVSDDFTGSTVKATLVSGTCRPFAVFNGSQATVIPNGCSSDDHIFDQALPLSQWGTTYFVAPFALASEYTVRMVAALDGTAITVNGGPPTLLNAGQYTTMNSVPNTPLCISSNLPIGVVQYMESINCCGVGDPSFLQLNAQEMEIDRVTFATVPSAVMTDHYVNVTASVGNLASITLDGTPIGGPFTTFADCPTHAYVQVPITSGSHTLDAGGGRFIAYVYGMGGAETYAYSMGSFNPVPVLPVDSVFCQSGPITLNAPITFNNVYWTTYSDTVTVLATGTSWTFTPTANNIFTAHGQNPFSGCPQQYFCSVELADPLGLVLTGGATSVCAYTPVQLNVDVSPSAPNYVYSWSPAADLNDATIADPVALPSITTWYVVDVQTIGGCASATDSVLVTVLPGGILSFSATTDDPWVCTGDSSQLFSATVRIVAQDDLAAGIGSMWGAVLNGSASAACGSVSGNALYFDGAGQRSAGTTPLNTLGGGTVRFALKIANGAAPCEDADPGENVVLEYSINGGAGWSPMNTYLESAYPAFTVINEAIPAGAQSAATLFRWRQVANGGAGEDHWALDNVAIGVVDNAYLTYAWTPAAQVSNGALTSPMAYPLATGFFHITATDPNTLCVYTDSVLFNVGNGFTLAMTPDTAICDVAGIQLQAIPSGGNNHNWVWSPNATITSIFSPTPTVTPPATVTYTVSVTSQEGCTATGDVTINVGQLLDLTVTTSDLDLCVGETATLNANVGSAANMAFLWSPASNLNDATLQSPTASPLQDTWYVVMATDTVSGCQLMDSVEVAVTLVGGIDAGNDTTVCTALGLQLDVLFGGGMPTISWEPSQYLIGAGTATPTITFDSTMTYVVEVGDGAGCSAFDTVLVTMAFSTLENFSDSSLCAGDSAFIDAGFPWATHTWSPGGQTTQTIWVESAGSYTVTMQDSTGCQVQNTTTITIDPLPIVALGPDTSLCVGENWLLIAGDPGSDFLWSTTATTQTITTNVGGTFSVLVTDQNACVNSDTINIVFDPLPVINLLDTAVCVSETVVLDASNPGSTYVWMPTGQTTQTISVSAATGPYSVVVTTSTICIDSATAVLTFLPFPEVDLGADTALCDTEQLVLNAQNDTCTFLWSTGATTQAITLFASENIWVDVFNDHCTTRDTINVIFNPLPNELTLDVVTICLDYPPYFAELNGENPGNAYEWSPTGEVTQVILAKDYGWYMVHLTTPLDCSIQDSILVQEYCTSTLYVPNTFTPDGDGFNDIFLPNGWNLATVELRIYDRWGELMSESRDAQAKWDGTYGGTVSPDGVYVWKVKYRFYENAEKTVIGAEHESTGHLTLMR